MHPIISLALSRFATNPITNDTLLRVCQCFPDVQCTRNRYLFLYHQYDTLLDALTKIPMITVKRFPEIVRVTLLLSAQKQQALQSHAAAEPSLAILPPELQAVLLPFQREGVQYVAASLSMCLCDTVVLTAQCFELADLRSRNTVVC
jgi:hypothetical protein